MVGKSSFNIPLYLSLPQSLDRPAICPQHKVSLGLLYFKSGYPELQQAIVAAGNQPDIAVTWPYPLDQEPGGNGDIELLVEYSPTQEESSTCQGG